MLREEIIQMAIDAILEINEDKARQALSLGKEEGISAVELMQEGFSKGMSELGDRFGRGDAFLPELIFASEVMKIATDAVDKELSALGVDIQGDLLCSLGELGVGEVLQVAGHLLGAALQLGLDDVGSLVDVVAGADAAPAAVIFHQLAHVLHVAYKLVDNPAGTVRLEDATCY